MLPDIARWRLAVVKASAVVGVANAWALDSECAMPAALRAPALRSASLSLVPLRRRDMWPWPALEPPPAPGPVPWVGPGGGVAVTSGRLRRLVRAEWRGDESVRCTMESRDDRRGGLETGVDTGVASRARADTERGGVWVASAPLATMSLATASTTSNMGSEGTLGRVRDAWEGDERLGRRFVFTHALMGLPGTLAPVLRLTWRLSWWNTAVEASSPRRGPLSVLPTEAALSARARKGW